MDTSIESRAPTEEQSKDVSIIGAIIAQFHQTQPGDKVFSQGVEFNGSTYAVVVSVRGRTVTAAVELQ